jgi:hypothetical protein
MNKEGCFTTTRHVLVEKMGSQGTKEAGSTYIFCTACNNDPFTDLTHSNFGCCPQRINKTFTLAQLFSTLYLLCSPIDWIGFCNFLLLQENKMTKILLTVPI